MKTPTRWDSWQLASFPTKRIALDNDEEVLNAVLEGKVLPKMKFSQYFNPFAYNLCHFDWSVIGVGTFEREALTYNARWSEELRQKEFTRLVGFVCNIYDIRPRTLVFYGKTEFGASQRCHYHFLIGKRGADDIPPSGLAATFEECWTYGTWRRGCAKIRPFDDSQKVKAILYQTKQEFDFEGRHLPLNELHSPTLIKLIQRNNSI